MYASGGDDANLARSIVDETLRDLGGGDVVVDVAEQKTLTTASLLLASLKDYVTAKRARGFVANDQRVQQMVRNCSVQNEHGGSSPTSSCFLSKPARQDETRLGKMRHGGLLVLLWFHHQEKWRHAARTGTGGVLGSCLLFVVVVRVFFQNLLGKMST